MVTAAHGGNLFAVSRAHGWDWRDAIDFSASINPLGPAPGVAAAVLAALDRIPHYPEREPAELRRALARLWRVDADSLVVGNGATELLHWFARTVQHDAVTLAVPVFSEFHRAYPGARTVPADVPARWPEDGLLVLTQPNNPTGRALDPVRLRAWLAATGHPVLIDESFLEFTGLPSCADLLERRPNLFLLRSLTKFYALPGLRVGALLAAAGTASRWRESREPWQVNVLAEAAALAAIADEPHACRTVEFVAREREWLAAQLAALPGVSPQPSSANYLLVRVAYAASALCRHLLDRRILVRDCAETLGMCGEAVRIAVRTRPENVRLLAAWKEFSCDL